MSEDPNVGLLTLTADIVSAHVAHNHVASAELPMLIKTTYDALAGLGTPIEEAAPKLTPAVSIRASVKPDHIVCLEDGKKLTMLKRYLKTHFDMTPEQYRTKWNLAADYPMVAPDYADRRRDLAKSIGLGRKPVAEVATPAPARVRKPKVAEVTE